MARMDWEDFQRDHHRPHLLVVSVEPTTAPELPVVKADVERLAVRLGAIGNYAIKAEGITVYAAFEDNGDAERFAEVFRPKQITRESEWASKAWARMDGAALQRIADILGGVRLTTKRRRFSPR
ncbi:hypothetical protein [Reyranella soli]|uniref:Uncharacterized protein n=1 Tax=Reyranella soli TaxID=1230389 RepID=A0A512NLL7_9HYPH|nr:hypothetical protein [Reyranella soli]GEP59832.1 hypothetical protein RSO01_69980 [Reyranella soli]